MIDRLLLVGCGLMGGSVAAGLRAQCPQAQVWVVDPSYAKQALEQGIAQRVFESVADMLKAADEPIAQGLVFATPVHVTASLLSDLASLGLTPVSGSASSPVSAPASNTAPADASTAFSPSLLHNLAWITELGSVKGPVIKTLNALPSGTFQEALLTRFVPSHPMAGSEQSGLSAALDSLLEGARVLISRLPENQPEAVDGLEVFFSRLGGQPIALPLDEHDELLAALSHLPHLLAYGLAGMLASGPYAAAAQSLHGGGLRDTTRIASSSPALWSGILLENREAVLALMTQYRLSLSELVHALEANDAQALSQSLERASQWRHQFS
jgi:prephenate dehydrogenase